MQDVRYGLRRVLQSPGFSAVVVATLALGIGANAALFSVVDAVLLRALPYAAPERLVTVEHYYPSLNHLKASVSAPGFRDYATLTEIFSGVAVEDSWGANLTGEGEPERLRGALVSGRFFGTLGVPPAAGRPVVPGDDVAGRERVVVLSHGLAERLLGGPRRAVGRSLLLNGRSYQVVGVMPPSFRDVSKQGVELWAPLVFSPEDLAEANRPNEHLALVARLRPGISPERAQAELTGFAGRLKRAYLQIYPADWNLALTTLHEKAVGDLRVRLLVLLGAVGAVLLIACANVASLLLARASGRAREVAVRTALGATRWQLVRQLLVESLLLALAGGALGLALAVLAMRAAARAAGALAFAGLPLADLRLDPAVLLFTAAAALGTGLLFGLAPALATARADTQQTLREGGRSASAGRSRQRVRRALVIAEVALALALLVSAGLLVKSFARLADVSTGFRPDHLLTFTLSLPKDQYPTEAQQVALFDRALARLRAVPGVIDAGATSTLPFSGDWATAGFQVEGYVPPPKEPAPWGDLRVVTPGFFSTLGVPLLRGRAFTEEDGPRAVKVAVVDEEMVRRYWPHADPLGKRILFSIPGKPTEPLTVVGVVRHTKHEGLDAGARVQLYLPLRQMGYSFLYVALRTATEPRAALPAVRAALREVDPALPLFGVHTMSELVEGSTAPRRVSALLLALFSGMALLLASLGIYGVMSYAVAQRGHELGVRMALGAAKGEMLRLVLGQGMALAASGLALGVVAALGLTRLLQSQLFAVQPTDPETFLAVTAILAAVALAANLLPALRATRVDPVVALREE